MNYTRSMYYFLCKQVFFCKMELINLIRENLASIFVFIFTLIVVCLYSSLQRKHGVPPGPRRLPIVGNLGSLIGKDTLNILANLRLKYGDVYGVYIGSQLNVFLNGYDVIHDALVKRGSLFSRRPENNIQSQKVQEWVAIVQGNGSTWKELRTFALNTFRDLCFRKTGFTFEQRVLEELTFFTEELGKRIGEDVDVSQPITLSFANIMYSILHGHRIGYNDTNFKDFLDGMDESFRRHITTQTLNACFPYLRYLPGDLLSLKFMKKYIQELDSYYEEICQENFRNYRPGDENCFIDYWIAAGEDKPTFKRKMLWIVLHDFMAAGSETTAATLKWIILALVKYPDIQRKLQRKVDKVIKKGETPSVTDKPKLLYVEATILEALRIGSTVPLSLPHAVQHDTIFHGLHLSKDVTIIPNIASVHFDPEYFPEPEKFKPERFLTEDETAIIGTEKLIPFSLGPRSCVGETLARVELFLYLTTLVQKMEFRASVNAELPSMKGVFGLTRQPQDFKVSVHLRS